jgi:hypothetical protein
METDNDLGSTAGFADDSSNNNATTTTTAANLNAKLVDVSIRDKNEAFQALIKFLALAQSRGVYTFDESAKIYECIQMFRT